MKNAALFLLAVMALVQTPAGQFLKLPILVEHFIQHRNLQSDSLSGFITDHYLMHHEDEDQSEDDQLPFKEMNVFMPGSAIITPLIFADTGLIPSENTKVFFRDTDVIDQNSYGIFHPPRL